MKKIIQKLLSLGIHNGLSKNEEKLVKLLNLIIVTWYAILVMFSITDYFFEEKYFEAMMGYLFMVVLFLLVQFLQHKRMYTPARVLFISISFLQIFLFSNFIVQGNLIELFYLLTPLFSLLFLSNKKFHYFYLILAIITFILPKYYFDIYDEELFADPTTVPILFIATFLLVSYFKNLNVKNEALLNEQKNRALKANELIESQKQELETLHNFQNQFFVNIAHEIRTPLTIIKGNTTKIKKELSKQPESIINTIHTLETQTNKIQHIVNDVMDLTKMDSNTFELKKVDIYLSEFISRVYLSFHSNFQNKNIDYQLVDNTNSRVILSGDALYLEGALNNIILNAFKYTDVKGFVHITLEQDDSNNVIIKISDSGIGIKKSDVDKIFNRFYQSDNSVNRSGGSGIGLAFSKEIIEKHQGSVKVISEEEKGSTFIVSVPIKTFSKENQNINPIEASIEEPSTPISAPTNSHSNILLVDDHKEMRDYIKSVLEGFTVIEASDGLEALEMLEKHQIHYMITDYMMPKMDGYELVQNVKQKSIDIPVLILTARTDNKAKLDMLRLGIDDYITKPFDEEELLVRISIGLNNNTDRKKYIQEKKIPQVETKDSKFINSLKAYIETNCTKEYFGVQDICDDFALSQSSLFRKIKSLTGLNTKAFITEVRLQKARSIHSEDPNLSFKEIGYEVGFVNYTHFSNLYKKRFGNNTVYQ